MRFPSSVKRDPAIDIWMRERPGALAAIAQPWFEVMRGCGDDVRPIDTAYPNIRRRLKAA